MLSLHWLKTGQLQKIRNKKFLPAVLECTRQCGKNNFCPRNIYPDKLCQFKAKMNRKTINLPSKYLSS